MEAKFIVTIDSHPALSIKELQTYIKSAINCYGAMNACEDGMLEIWEQIFSDAITVELADR